MDLRAHSGNKSPAPQRRMEAGSGVGESSTYSTGPPSKEPCANIAGIVNRTKDQTGTAGTGRQRDRRAARSRPDERLVEGVLPVARDLAGVVDAIHADVRPPGWRRNHRNRIVDRSGVGASGEKKKAA